ncbi:class I adenylate-forming enzyme family protein [Streptomyces iconiensis]|uniref:AMP-binding protein n=1 Tax=Streptomyces iconiensis TaxID=1384038 RepID=A0ABT6ZQC2_9ACTN|nr:AMP-binding protein [Streptomyces iconiensis]MDJ1131258.1 AMP-binding protein [Streptomyces iconiensis]
MNRFVQAIVSGMSGDPRAVALVQGKRRLTHGEALEEVHRAARGLAERGVRGGDAVVLLVGNTPEAVLYRVAAHLIGCCVAVLEPNAGGEVRAAVVRTLGPAALVVDPRYEEVAEDTLRHVEVPRVLTLGRAGLGEDLLPLVAGQSAAPVEPVAGECDRAMVMYTSGTGGEAKAACHTFSNLAEWLRMERSLRHPGPRRFLHHGSMNSVSAENILWNLAAGGTTVLMEGGGPEEVLAAVEQERITYLLAYPTMLARLTAACPAGGGLFPELRQIQYGSAPATTRLLREALAAFGPRLLGVYGSREAGFLTSLGCDEHSGELLGSVGTPLPGVRVAVRTPEDGAPVETGGTGEVWVRTPAAMTGYIGRAEGSSEGSADEGSDRGPDGSSPVFRDGWLRTGDLGRVDGTGRLHLMGRGDDVIIVGGYNVHAREVEEALAEHPDVTWTAVVGVPEAAGGEAVHAAVVASPGSPVDAEALRSWVRTRLSTFHTPASVRLVQRPLLTPRGKTDRRAVRALVRPSVPAVRDASAGGASAAVGTEGA